MRKNDLRKVTAVFGVVLGGLLITEKVCPVDFEAEFGVTKEESMELIAHNEQSIERYELYLENKRQEEKEFINKYRSFARTGTEDLKYDEATKTSDFKGFSYSQYISRDSEQGKILNESKTGEYGIKYRNDRILVSISKEHKLSLRDDINIELDSGNIMKCTVADIKENDGADINIICDKNLVPEMVKKMGTFSCIDDFEGYVVDITLVNINK